MALKLLWTETTSKNEGFKFVTAIIVPWDKFELNVVPVLPYNTPVVPVIPLMPTSPPSGWSS
jgi:hypothetical protein